MSENFEIVPRHDDTPAAKETTPNMLSILETVADGFGKVIAAFIGGVGQAIAGVALGAAKFAGHIIDAAKEIAGGIAKAIKGEGASMKVISGAVDERLGPLDTAITEAGEKFSEISDKVDESIREQDRLHEDMVKNDELITQTREEAEQARLDRVSAEQTMNNEIASALRKAESAQTSADGKSTIYYGSATPKSPKDGDTWFKTGTGTSQMLQFAGGKWVQRTDFAQLDKDLADNKRAVEAAARDVAAAQEKVKQLTEVELPAISAGTAEFNQKLQAETQARERELAAANAALTNAKLDLGKSMTQLEDRLKLADTQLKTAMDNKVRDDLAAAKRDLGKSMTQLEDRLKLADTQLETRVGKAAAKELEDAKRDLGVSMTQLEDRLKLADTQLETRVGKAATKELELAKQDLNRSLTEANAALATAREDLDEQMLSKPGNIFPDPFFGHKCWGTRRQNTGIKIVANGTRTGAYFANNRSDSTTGVQLEPGATYLLTAELALEGDVSEVWVYISGTRSTETGGSTYGVAGKLTKQSLESGAVAVAVTTVKVSTAFLTGSMTVGFFVPATAKTGSAFIDNVRMVRAADNSLIVDGAVTAGKVQAGAIETSKLAADAVTADKIKAGAIVAGKLAANSVAATNLQADSVTANAIKSDQILSKHIKANQVTATEIASNTITALQIAAGTITANELAADSVTAKQIKADAVTADKIKSNSIFAEHLVIGGPANLIANGSFTEGREPWASELSVRTISASQALPPGDRYAITSAGQGSLEAHTGRQWFAVTPEALYAFEIWLFADKEGSVFFLELRDQYGNHAGKSTPDVVSEGDISSSSNAVYLVSNVEVKKGWNKYSTVYRMGRNVTRARLGTFYFNHSNGSVRDAQIGFAGISLRPMTSADLIVQGAVVADKIAANAVTAKSIASNEILTRHIKSNQITTNELAAGAVRADNIAAGQITADKIGANQITGKHVLANSITANELQIRPGNMFPDPDFQDPCWGTSGAVYAHPNNGGELRFFPDGVQHGLYYQPAGYKDRSFMLEEGAQYRITATTWASTSALAKAKIDIYTRYIKPDGKVGIQLVGSLPVDGSGRSTPSCVITMPSDMKDGLCTLGFFLNPPWNGGQISMWNVQMVRAADASLIVDGAILATHIKAGTITGNEIAGDTITGTNLKADTITGREVKSGTINADQLKVNNGWIKNAMIGNAEIDSSKIKSIDAGSITTGTMSGKRIDADSITVRQLRANSIIPIGGSLIHHEPPPSDDTKPPEPIWWQTCDKELPENYSGWPRPEGNPWRMSSGAQGKYEAPSVPKRLVKVKPGQKYRLRFWCRATRANTRMFIEMRDQNGKHAVKNGAVYGTVDNGEYQSTKKEERPWPAFDYSKSTAGSYLVNNFTVPTGITLVTSTIEFNEGVEYVYLDHFYFNHSNGSAQGNQRLAGLSLELDIPDQAEVDRLQDENAKRIEDGVKLNTKFSEQQKKVNRMVQNQQWVHQDMIELLDIRTPKLYGWPSGYSMEGKKTTCPYNNRSGHRIATPFYEQWECGSGKNSEVIVAARGQWTGWMHVSINWDSGVIDDWAVEITPTDRIGSFTGGAYHIDIRSISVEVYPRSLNRKATIILFDDPPQDVWQKMFPGNLSGDDSRPRKKWDSYGDDNRLFRHMLKKRIRLKNTVTCDRNVWVRDEEGNRQQIRAGNNIYAAEIYPEDQDYANGTKFTFTEVDDPVRMDEADRFGYEVGKERPSGTPTNYESRVR